MSSPLRHTTPEQTKVKLVKRKHPIMSVASLVNSDEDSSTPEDLYLSETRSQAAIEGLRMLHDSFKQKELQTISATNSSSESRSGSEESQPSKENTTPPSLTFSSSNSNNQNALPENRQYNLVIRQQPFHARVCGFGEKDRRPIDPPPIVQLVIKDDKGQQLLHVPDISFFVSQTFLMDESGKIDQTVLIIDQQPVRMLMGQLASNCYSLQDEKRQKGFFFIFPDLSIRMEGVYRLKFTVVNVGWTIGKTAGGEDRVLCHVLSEPFKAYTAKKFPGMKESGELMKAFARQGMKLIIRKEREKDHDKEKEMDKEDVYKE